MLEPKKLLEKDIESAVVKYAKLHGLYVRKFSSPSNIGVPDRIFINYLGRVFFIEFKSPKGDLTPIQEREIEELKKRDVSVYVVKDIETGKRIIDDYLEVRIFKKNAY